MPLVVFRRPSFGTLDLISATDGDTLKCHLATQLVRYDEFMNDVLLPAQRGWLEIAQACGLEADSAAQLATHPCTDHSNSRNRFEQIETTVTSTGRWTVRQLLYIYVPKEVGQACQRAQSLDPIPIYMRVLDHDGRRKMLAVDIPPYAANTSVEKLVKTYRSAECLLVEAKDIACCLVIAKSDWIRYDQQKGVFIRDELGSFDVVAIAPVLLPSTLPEVASDDD
ncbi:RolB family protein [Bradyrhizobium sp. Cp5.3]|uniref:RolB family protein n=1 Tax=Bradyrhizobium sp. Cp5.3 TaxID=443598 RepID=UPI0009FDEB0D|nr:RolB family protein [Bradyrhizobium sp. Cp5.3]